MTELLTAAQMRAIEADAIESGVVTGLELMEKAGRGVVDAILAHWPEMSGTPTSSGGQPPDPRGISGQKKFSAVVLCGPGNNGGDGFVIARLLNGLGWRVEVFFYGDAEKLPPDARANHDAWARAGDARTVTEVAREGEGPDVLIDAMFGTGATRPLPLDCAAAFQAVRKRGGGRCKVVAVDCPSGFDVDRGEFVLPEVPDADKEIAAFMQNEIAPRQLHADLCVTFHRAKMGHWLQECSVSQVRPVVVDIGLPEGAEINDPAVGLTADKSPPYVKLVAPPQDVSPGSMRVWLRHTVFAQSVRQMHKYERGHVLVLGGGVGRGGAARLAARAALRVGAGLVTIGVPEDALAENATQLNAIMLKEINDPNGLASVLEDKRLSALCLGPGLGVGQQTRAYVECALAAGERRCLVLDADALTAFEEEPQRLFDLTHSRTVLTPHEGEFARLFPDLAATARGKMSKVEAVRTAAARAGCTVLSKGPATVIASPDGKATIHGALYDLRAGWLGTAGAGDVLAGLIAGVLAGDRAQLNLHERVEAATWLHAEAARQFGPGLIAEDLPEEVPKVLRRFGI